MLWRLCMIQKRFLACIATFITMYPPSNLRSMISFCETLVAYMVACTSIRVSTSRVYRTTSYFANTAKASVSWWYYWNSTNPRKRDRSYEVLASSVVII